MSSSLRHEYRPDIDGLRAVAIIIVVAFHAFPGRFTGGFIGVDVFFVISGFLITGILLRDIEKGGVNFRDFYVRRVIRIFPALLLVLFSCLAFGWLALLADEYQQLGTHVSAAAVFLSNFVLMGEAGYFDNSAETKPLLHLWSLGIEEQFYMLWPLLLWLARKVGFNILAAMVMFTLSSFLLNVGLIRESHIDTFYSPQTRFWELSLGGCLAWVVLYREHSLAWAKARADGWLSAFFRCAGMGAMTSSSMLSWLGILLIAGGLFSMDRQMGYPGWWAVFPVLGAALILVAGNDAWINRVVLSHRIAVWFGLISFPLYLWHWPLLSLARITEGEMPHRGIRVAAVLAAVVLAWATYELVERRARSLSARKTKVAVLVALMAVAGVAGYAVDANDGLPQRKVLAGMPEPIRKLGEDDPAAHALCMSRYGMEGEKARYCRLSGEGQPHVALVGDSHAAALFSGLSDALMQRDRTGLLMMGGYLFVNAILHPEGQRVEFENYTGGSRATAFIAREKSIDTVIMAARGPVYITTPHPFYLPDHPEILDKKKVLEVGLRSVLDLMLQNGKKVVFVLEVPTLDFSPDACLDQRPLRISRKAHDCSLPRGVYDSVHGEYRNLVFSILKDYPSVKIFDPGKYMCDDFSCAGKIESKILYGDDNHISADGSAFLASELVKLLD